MKLLELIGRGKLSISAAHELASSVAASLQFFKSFSFQLDEKTVKRMSKLNVIVGISTAYIFPVLPPPPKVDDCEIPPQALKAFASLGADGQYSSNCERDLHRWMKRLWGLQIETYTVWMDLQVPLGFKDKVLFSPPEVKGPKLVCYFLLICFTYQEINESGWEQNAQKDTCKCSSSPRIAAFIGYG